MRGADASDTSRRAGPGPARAAKRSRASQTRPTLSTGALALVATLLSGCIALQPTAPVDPAALAPEERTAHNLRVFDAAWDRVRRGYYDRQYRDLDWQKLREQHRAAAAAATNEDELYSAVNALLAELQDDHTRAQPPREVVADRAQQRVLLGLVLHAEDERAPESPMLVLQVMPGSAAAEAGVQPGWVLLRCDDRPPREVLGPGRLAAGQVVQCVFRNHTAEVHTLSLAARALSLRPVLEARVLGDGFVYLRFDRFDTGAAHWMRQQLKAHARAPGVIVDLRVNPGGDAAALGRILGEFFPRQVPIGTFVTRRGINFRLQSWRWLTSACYTGPLAVLVSENSASSSEIFAAVIQHHERGPIIGTTTAGAVLASRRFGLPDGGRLQLSIDDYVTPAGDRLEGVGVKPDIAVETTLGDLRVGRDVALATALRELRKRAAERR